MKTATEPKDTSRSAGPDSQAASTMYKLTVDLQVLKHLGIGLYSNVPAVVSEMVANGYDADAEKVTITVEDGEIVIQDDGLGMDDDDANDKFLTVGYDKRNNEAPTTPKYARKPMGRKGIGKLSAFAIAGEVEVQSVKTHPKTGKELGRAAFVMDVAEIEKKAKKKASYNPEPLDKSKMVITKGTRITLRKLKKKRSINADYVRRNLARRFSILGQNFHVFVNGNEVTTADRQYWDNLQFVWGLGDSSSYGIAKQGKKVKKTEVLTQAVNIPGAADEEVSGWIGTVKYPRELKDGDFDNNGIVILARGRLVHENMLPFARTARMFTEYVVGEIDADWLDDTDEVDIATSDRQSLKEDDPRFAALRSYVIDRLTYIADKWSEWRREVGLKEAVDKHPALREWLDGMLPDNRKRAEKLISTIEGMPISEPEDKKELIKHGIMAFETLALKGNLDALSEMESIDVEDLKEIIRAMEDLEIAHYYQVAKTRWSVLQQVQKLVDANEKEKFLQEKIYSNTWLMDAAWERATHDVDMEKRFTDKLKAKKVGLDKNKQLSRYDIKYLTVSGKDLIVELKRSGRKITVPEIIDQVRKYHDIMTLLAQDSGKTTNFDIIVLVGTFPTAFGRNDEDALKPYKARVMTYSGLIDHARASYGDYLERQIKVEKIQKIVDRL